MIFVNRTCTFKTYGSYILSVRVVLKQIVLGNRQMVTKEGQKSLLAVVFSIYSVKIVG